MSCPHSSRPEATPATCSQCIGITPTSRTVAPVAPDDVDLSTWDYRPTVDEQAMTVTGRRGAAARANRRRRDPSVQRANAIARWGAHPERDAKIVDLFNSGVLATDIAVQLAVAKGIIYRALRAAGIHYQTSNKWARSAGQVAGRKRRAAEKEAAR
jgi:hypothetical protein